jgi:hypothetical protein
MVVYGGIFDICKELNDMHVFDMKNDRWVCLFEELYSPQGNSTANSPEKFSAF